MLCIVKRKKSVSPYHKKIGSLMKKGLSMKQAHKAVKGRRFKQVTSGGNVVYGVYKPGKIKLRKRKVYKKRVASSSMARRRKTRTIYRSRPRRRSAKRSSGGRNNPMTILKNAAKAAMMGAGTVLVLTTLGRMFNFAPLIQLAPIAGGLVAFSAVPGIGGMVGAAVIALPSLGSLQIAGGNTGGGGLW